MFEPGKPAFAQMRGDRFEREACARPGTIAAQTRSPISRRRERRSRPPRRRRDVRNRIFDLGGNDVLSTARITSSRTAREPEIAFVVDVAEIAHRAVPRLPGLRRGASSRTKPPIMWTARKMRPGTPGSSAVPCSSQNAQFGAGQRTSDAGGRTRCGSSIDVLASDRSRTPRSPG